MNVAHAAQDRRALLLASLVCAIACASSAPAPASTAATPHTGTVTDTARGRQRSPADTVPGLPPPGFGTLRQDDISLKLSVSNLQVRATPLGESIIRLLSPDSYRALSELKRSKSEAIAAVARRNGVRDLSLWYVSFFAVEQGETRFSPREFIITNVGRDFRPLDILPITPGFGEQRLRQNGRQDGLYVFDGQLDVQQPLTVSYETARNDSWGQMLPQIERERALVKSRAAARRVP
ncbi:MAG TPA: hypothetical protein VL308_13630 [Gemmatimonadaceae bacterium]|jgi:hypothetical protein|nr:hypothetical protein [Gemmatimonadaceae bacterium]